MKKTNMYLASGVLTAVLMSANVDALAARSGEPMYNFLPREAVVENVKNSLQNHGIDISAIEVDADAKGVVQLNGQVASKQEADAATQVAKDANGVYAVLGQWRYAAADAASGEVPSGMDTVMDNAPPASGAEQTPADMQQPDAQ